MDKRKKKKKDPEKDVKDFTFPWFKTEHIVEEVIRDVEKMAGMVVVWSATNALKSSSSNFPQLSSLPTQLPFQSLMPQLLLPRSCSRRHLSRKVMRQSTDDSAHHDPDLYNDVEKVSKRPGEGLEKNLELFFFPFGYFSSIHMSTRILFVTFFIHL